MADADADAGEGFSVVAVDQRGIGLSGKPQAGYDTATLASDLVALMDALGHQRFALYGTDVGMPVAYALAADHRERVARLVVSEAPLPGISPSPPLFLPPQLNERLWHLAFNQLPKINEQLVQGREDIGGGESSAEVGNTMKLAADDVQTLVIPGCGHWVAEQAPDQLLAALTTFLAPYRDGPGS
jgi:pimeloyl-ACP methyl ester carboxylesterase